MRALGRSGLAVGLALLVVLILLGSSSGSAAAERPLGTTVPTSVAPAAASVAGSAHDSAAAAPPAAPPRTASAPESGRTVPDASTWTSQNFFQDVQVSFSGPGLTSQFLTVPYTNTVPITTLGFWMNISSAAPILSATVTIWGTQWPGQYTGTPINDFTPSNPALRPMVVNTSDPSIASYYFDDYRFFWPGSQVGFNITVVGQNTSPSEIKSAWNVSNPMGPYPGGYINDATWQFDVASPWASPVFTDDIAVVTTPDVLSHPAYEPNMDQSVSVSLNAIDLGGTLSPIPQAVLLGTLTQNGSSSAFSETFGPANHTSMTMINELGPYPGASISFNVSASLPWEGGQLDKIVSPQYNFSWSPNGGWWHPTDGLSANVALTVSPTLTPSLGSTGSTVTILPTAAVVNVTLHEPIENVTIASSQVQFTFTDGGVSHSGILPMTVLNANTTTAVLPGLPPGALVTFEITAKDIFGDPVASGNYSYTEAGPTNPSLPSGRGLIFAEVLDLSGGGLLAGFPYTLSNATWSESGKANLLGFAVPVLPGSGVPYQLSFGTYSLTIRAFGATQVATVTLSPDSPMPVVVFYGESVALPITTSGTIGVDSFVAALGLIGAAVVTLPLLAWFDERKARAEAEQRRVTL